MRAIGAQCPKGKPRPSLHELWTPFFAFAVTNAVFNKHFTIHLLGQSTPRDDGVKNKYDSGEREALIIMTSTNKRVIVCGEYDGRLGLQNQGRIQDAKATARLTGGPTLWVAGWAPYQPSGIR